MELTEENQQTESQWWWWRIWKGAGIRRGAGRAQRLTFAVVTSAGFAGTGQLWLEVDLLGDAPLDDGRDRRPR